jgi:hypothetical protein
VKPRRVESILRVNKEIHLRVGTLTPICPVRINMKKIQIILRILWYRSLLLVDYLDASQPSNNRLLGSLFWFINRCFTWVFNTFFNRKWLTKCLTTFVNYCSIQFNLMFNSDISSDKIRVIKKGEKIIHSHGVRKISPRKMAKNREPVRIYPKSDSNSLNRSLRNNKLAYRRNYSYEN